MALGERARLNADYARAAVATFRSQGGGWTLPETAPAAVAASSRQDPPAP
ncbi:hypothetical protein ACXKTX_24845 [Burkholderia gladioli]